MNRAYTFIEAVDLSGVVKAYFGTDEAYADFQSELAENPDVGTVIAGAAPLRKLRWGDKQRGMGKR